jgi:plastocyanin
MKRQSLFPLAGTILVLAACSSYTAPGSQTSNTPPPPTGTPAQAVTVEVRSNYYNPSNPLIAAGGTVTWDWIDSGHSVTSDGTPSFAPNAPVSNAPHTLGPIIFATVGTYSFHCTIHGVAGVYGSGTMTGAVFVQ